MGDSLLQNATDAFVDQTNPATNHGNAAKLWLRGSGSSNEKRAYIYFKPPFPLGATIFSAKLRVFTYAAWASSQVVTAQRIDTAWAESLIDWTNRASTVVTNQVAVTVAGATAGQQIEFDVSAMMGDVSNGSAFFGFMLKLDTDVVRLLNSGKGFAAAARPQLEVEWAEGPDPPTGLDPGGGAGISSTKPILSWVYGDPEGASAQASSQVQTSLSTSFASPEYDSGMVANLESQWDLSATGYSALADGATRYWRVRVTDDLGLVSDWSDTVEFVRVAPGTLTITSPTTSTIDDLTPPVAWTLATRTQEAYRVILYRVEADGSTTVLWDTGKVTSVATSVTVPSGGPNVPTHFGFPPPIIRSGQTFRVEVRVWDTEDRLSITGDPAYLEQTSIDFTYARSGAPAAVLTLTATAAPNANGPGVLLTWTRAAMPDYFCLVIDSVEQTARIDPTDVFVSGTTYAMTWWGASPRVGHTYEIEAVVNSAGDLQHSDGNATATFQTNPTGMWLIDPTDDTNVRITGQEDTSQLVIGETGTTYDLVSGRTPIRITDTVRGYEGALTGYLMGKADRDTFLTLKGRLTVLWFIMSDLAIPVMLEEVSAPASPLSGDRMYLCGFSLFQVANFTFDVVGG